MNITPGTRLGPYEILAPLGAGGMGEVYRARDPRLGREVAIKVLPSHLSANPQLRERFDREARAISALSHPHICTVYDVGHQDGVDFLVMEYIEGETLADRLLQGPLPLEQVVRYGAEIAEALDKAHRQGIVHRDLKPGNIMITRSGAKVLDFGLAKYVAPSPGAFGATLSPRGEGPTERRPLTQEGAILGTIQYMAPEQLEGKEADVRTDIFALGTILYEMVTGKHAFEGKSKASLIASIMDQDPPPISTLQPMTPRALDGLVRTCLEKEPAERWQSAHDVKRALELVLEPARDEKPSPSRVARWLPWAIAAAALVVAGVLAVVNRGRPPIEPQLIQWEMEVPDNSTIATSVEEHNIAVSPDGNQLAFVLRTGGQSRIWLRSLDRTESQSLAGTDGASSPFWSPDSRWIAFFANRKLKKIPAAGGPAQTLCDVEGVSTGSWGRDGTIVFTLLFQKEQGMYRVPSSGGRPKQIIGPDLEKARWRVRWPEFLPDGRHFLFLASDQQSQQDTLRVGSLDSGETAEVMAVSSRALFSPPGHLLYVKDATLVAQPFDLSTYKLTGEATPVAEELPYFITGWSPYSISRNGVLAYQAGSLASQFVWLDRKTGKVEPVGPPGNYIGLRLSPDGRSVVMEKRNPSTGTSDLWRHDFERGVTTRLTHDDEGLESLPVWAPDGKRILYTIHGNKAMKVMSKRLDTGEETDFLPRGGVFQWARDWSADGRIVLYDQFSEPTGSDIWMLTLDGKSRPLLQTRFNEALPALSSDSQWMAYVSDESGRPEIYVRSLTGRGSGIQVSTGGASHPRWRRDGRELFYIAAVGNLMAMPTKLGERFDTGTASKVFQIRSTSDLWSGGIDLWGSAYDVTPDGQRFLLNVGRGWDSLPVMVVVNWPRALRD